MLNSSFFNVWISVGVITCCAVATALCINGDRPSQGEMANFGPLQNPIPSTDCGKNCHIWLRPWDDPLCQFRCKSFCRGLLGKWV